MMIERPLSIAVTFLGVALLVPDVKDALTDPGFDYDTGTVIAVALATLGTFMGSLFAAAHTRTFERRLGFVLFGVVGLGVSVGAVICGWTVDGSPWRELAMAGGFLPLAGWAVALVVARRAA